ncbi:transcription factor [Ganoderma sinense ZZ0214-1]|uniref:Transcription factor n=1 Tax=Ganoderma sinense ZZ0214-1 TaxID=1077348 RepID=A0A2G8S892_9APHY|nr:transcription factor [Ganoderma sinense ZZ0214-1]
MLPYHLTGGPNTFIDLNAPYPSYNQPVSPRGLYAATSGWAAPRAYGGYYDPACSSAFLQNLQSVIESSHTAQTQQQNAANMASSAQPSGAVQSSWTGSIDLATGVFQRSVEHPRLRTAQACEKCRIRKAKCTGDNPCRRCMEKGLKCEYAPERKMRGPNKNKRKATLPQKRSTASPAASDCAKPSSASTPASSDSDSAASCRQRSESSPSTMASYRLDIPSTHSSPTPAHHASPEAAAAFRPRSATVGQDPSACICDGLDAFAGAPEASTKPRPPHLDLSVPRQMYPRLLAEYARTTEQAPYPVPVETGTDSRTLLPTYLAESYSRIAQHNSDAAHRMLVSMDSIPVSHSVGNFVHPSLASSFPQANQHVLSNSPETSTPITPLSLAYDAAGSLMYPTGPSAFDNGYDSFEPSPVSSDNGHLGGFDGLADVLQAKAFDQDGWQAAAAAVHAQLADDETPRAAPNTLMAELMGPVDDAV